jgi:HEPN domain-containing protein
MLARTEGWLRQARADLASAEILLQGGSHYMVSWCAQQTAEKALKALYVEQRRGRLPPRTHDLEYLALEVAAPASLEADLDTLIPAFDMTRYPDDQDVVPVDAVSEQDAVAALSAARSILRWVEEQL